jgi:hypothetical protein
MVTTEAPIFIFAAYFAFILMETFAERAKNGQSSICPLGTILAGCCLRLGRMRQSHFPAASPVSNTLRQLGLPRP